MSIQSEAITNIPIVSAILWLENDVFLMAHTPSNSSDGLATTYHIMLRNKDTKEITFRKLPEVSGPWGLERSPPFQFMQRLRDFEPSLKDMIIVASTSSTDVGLFTKSSVPLNSETPADQIVDVFTTTAMANDSRRAQLPMSEAMDDTSPIGMALDLSSKSNVPRPLPGEEMDESQGPLPGLMILNNEGILAAWWVVYADSVRRGTHYSGLVMYAGQQQAQQNTSPPPASSASAAPAFGQSAFAQSGFASLGNNLSGSSKKPAAPAFGSSGTPGASGPAFGGASSLGGSGSAFGATTPSGASGSAFGGSSILGNRQSPWGSTAGGASQTGGSAFGQPSFGSSTPIGTNKTANTAFGATGGLGQKSSPWSSTPTTSGSAFGQPPGLGSQTSAFGSTGAPATSGPSLTNTSGSGFASFANTGGFASMAAKTGGGDSIWKQSPTTSSFGSSANTTSAFGTPAKAPEPFGNQKFVLGSAWKNENAGKQEPSQTSQDSKPTSLFGSGFGNMLGEAAKTTTTEASAEADMMDDTVDEAKKPETPVTQAPKSIFGTPTPKFPTAPPASSGQFGTLAQNQTTPAAAVQASTPAPQIKKEPLDESETPKETPKLMPEAPLPPDPTSKVSYTPGSSSASSNEPPKALPEMPLPPDFLRPKSKAEPQTKSAEEALPPPPPDLLKPQAKASEATSPPANAIESKTKDSEITSLPIGPIQVKPKTKDSNITSLPIGPIQVKPSTDPPQAAEEVTTPSDSPESKKSSSDEEQPPQLPDDAGDELDDEGSGVDIGQDLSPISDQSRNLTPESSFGGKIDKSSLGDFMKVGRSQPQQLQQPIPGRSLFGEIGKTSIPTLFPSKVQESPRSPSPQRQPPPGSLLQAEIGRSLSAPGFQPKSTFNRPVGLFAQPMSPISPHEQRPQRVPVPDQDEPERTQWRDKQQPAPEAIQDSFEEEDERTREDLSADPQPKLDLPDFLAHQDYTDSVRKGGIPGQVEKVFRDINSMLDTLGLNERHLDNFVRGNTDLRKDGQRERGDLSAGDDTAWCLSEIDDFLALQDGLDAELSDVRLSGVGAKVERCQHLQKELARLRATQAHIKRELEARTDAKVQEAMRTAPLAPEAAVLRDDLRRKFAEFQKGLAQLEEAVSMLRARLAAHSSSSSARPGSSGAAGKVPTVEAVERTILKMTAMAQRKSGDVERLEASMRKLGVTGDFSPASSRAGSPAFVTPPTSARRTPRGVPYTPGSSVNGGDFRTPRSTRSVLASSVRSSGSDLRASVGRRTDGPPAREDIEKYKAKMERRAFVNAAIKRALMRKEEMRQ